MRSKKILAVVSVNIVLVAIFAATQNCGRVNIAAPVVEEAASLAVSVSSELVIPVKVNVPETFSIPTGNKSASITDVSMQPGVSIIEATSSLGGHVQIDPTTWNITYTPAVGVIGSDRVTMFVTGSDQAQVAISILFVISNTLEAALPDLNALVYGESAEDRIYLQNKLAGYAPPGMAEIFHKWGRFSKNLWYNSASEIRTLPELSYCNTGINPTTGVFNQGTIPGTTTKINPGTHGNCMNNPEFVATSWTLMQAPERILCAANAGVVTGFVSPLSFEYYKHSAIVTSTNNDDDTIGIVIAFVRDSAGVNHVLAAVRTQGGFSPALGWGLVYYKDGSASKVLNNLDVGGVFRNGTAAPNNNGWSGRMSKISVVREGDLIIATASPWGMTEGSLVLADSSKITIDLSNMDLGLSIFRGARPYGYMTLSQLGSEYRDVQFSTGTNETYVYDLVNKIVYERQASGKYQSRSDLDAFTHIGTPRKVGNPDTGKIFQLNVNKTYKVVN